MAHGDSIGSCDSNASNSGSASNGSIKIGDIDQATVTIISSQVEEPATAVLTREDIANGWSFIFKAIPVGSANVTLVVLDKEGKILMKDSRNVDVESGTTTPVDFVIDLDSSGAGGCLGSECTGSIKVTVRARTSCLGRAAISPAIGKENEAVTLNINNIQGLIQTFKIDFGDGTPAQTVSSMPVKHTYHLHT